MAIEIIHVFDKFLLLIYVTFRYIYTANHPCFVVFANFPGENIHTITSVKLWT